MTITDKFFVECVKCGIKQEKISFIPNGIDYKKLYKLCITNSVSVIVFCALEDVRESLLPQFLDMLKKAVHMQIVLDTQSEHDKNVFLSEMEKRKLRYMPLKGYHLKKIYPLTAMRYASDCDVLIDVAQLEQIRTLVDELGMKTKRHDEHHDIVYFPVTKTIFELHKSVFVGPLEKYFANIFERSHLKEGTKYFYEMSPEDFYMSILAHSAYHFAADAGVGIRHLTDIYLYTKTISIDYNCLDSKLKKAGLLKFKDQFEKIAQFLFDGIDVDDSTKKLANHIIKSSLFAYEEKKAASDVAAQSNTNYNLAKEKTIIKSIFPPARHMQFSYPILKKHMFLIPLFYPIRWVHILVTRPKNIAKLKKYRDIDCKQIEYMMEIRKLLGLEYL